MSWTCQTYLRFFLTWFGTAAVVAVALFYRGKDRFSAELRSGKIDQEEHDALVREGRFWCPIFALSLTVVPAWLFWAVTRAGER